MKCEDVLLLISGHLDGENTAEEEQALQAHLCDCEACRHVMQAFEEADAGLIQTKEHAPDGLCADVMAQIKRESAKKKRRPWIGIVAAAGLMLVIGVGAAVEHTVPATEPQTISAEQPYTYTMARGVSSDAHAVAEKIVKEREACVAVVRELYYELESCQCETLEEGYVLYTLQDPDGASALAESYGCALYGPIREASASVSYALLAP
ncbi:MAG: zf-HC2 domain-containing protein [Oscillospiraceae bacterium]|nr:zf-HC2 domain-containing protein [Oscillospiraceae bacterium]